MHRMNKGVLALSIPITLSWLTVFKQSIVLLATLVFLNFFIIAVIPSFRRHESIWMFIIVAITSIPINLYALLLMNDWGFLFNSVSVLAILECILYYAVMFSIEEIIMGIITRLIWRRQYKSLM